MTAFRFLLFFTLLLTLAAASPPSINFTDQAAKANLTVVTYTGGTEKNHILESTGNGVLSFDYDGDGYQDLYFINAYRFPKRGEKEPH